MLAVVAWSAGWGFVLLVANATWMVPQLVIANLNTVSAGLLLQLAGSAGAICMSLLGFLAYTLPGNALLTTLLGTEPALSQLLLPVLRVGVVVPLLVSFQNCLQGFYIGRGRSWVVNVATLCGCALVLGSTQLLIGQNWGGATAAATSMVLGSGVELLLLLALALRLNLFKQSLHL